MSPSNFPLRWESTGDKWWYASPIDWAAANGHYDLVRELLRLDGNHLINLTSLRRIRRLEAVWDDEAQFDDVAKCRSEVAHQLFDECQTQKMGKDKNSLIVAGYGGWLLYTAASAGDLSFVTQLLRKYPLLVFGEGEYGLTDILYAAARSKNPEVFKAVYGFAISPRFLDGGGEMEEQTNEEVPMAFKLDVKNRAVHAAARGGNLIVLMELLAESADVLEFRDVNGSTVLHSAAGKGQVEVAKQLIASYDMISSIDDKGNTPLHIAAYRGQLSVLEALIQASPSSASIVNKAGETFLHMAVAGFQTSGFRRIDQQIELMKQLVSSKRFIIEDIINSENNEGRTALHLAIIGNIHSDLVQLLMSARYINVNIRDDHGMTPLDYLKRQPKSASSEIIIRQLISAGGISSCKDYAVRKAFASHLRMQSISNSPGTSFRVSDNEIFLGTGLDREVHPSLGHISRDRFHFHSSSEASHCGSPSLEDNKIPDIKKSGPLHNAAKRLKLMFHWPLVKRKETEKSKRTREKDESVSDKRRSISEETPIPLRERYSNACSISSNKRTLAVRSNISSPTNRKKLASGVAHDAFQDQLMANLSGQPSFSKSSFSSNSSLEKGKEICVEDENARPSSSLKQISAAAADVAPNVIRKQGSINKRFVNPILCFSGSHLSVKNSVKHCTKQPVIAVA
ncbi:hypothetical protein SOVF_202390 [Spinacia oleracea]|uniref:Uncharacterized protein n=1 Tax=Spinacia oleracea TaxID=3562 RepID=A0A9R0HQU3_SPIOL|nr:uncharacterized protein LOC110774922 [Spinacia oleracea]KNA04145.1 hypothetical protein SOVF_202390 [Spinacia oleracea]